MKRRVRRGIEIYRQLLDRSFLFCSITKHEFIHPKLGTYIYHKLCARFKDVTFVDMSPGRSQNILEEVFNRQKELRQSKE